MAPDFPFVMGRDDKIRIGRLRLMTLGTWRTRHCDYGNCLGVPRLLLTVDP